MFRIRIRSGATALLVVWLVPAVLLLLTIHLVSNVAVIVVIVVVVALAPLSLLLPLD